MPRDDYETRDETGAAAHERDHTDGPGLPTLDEILDEVSWS